MGESVGGVPAIGKVFWQVIWHRTEIRIPENRKQPEIRIWKPRSEKARVKFGLDPLIWELAVERGCNQTEAMKT